MTSVYTLTNNDQNLLTTDLNKEILIGKETYNDSHTFTFRLPTAALIGKSYKYANSFKFTIINNCDSLNTLYLRCAIGDESNTQIKGLSTIEVNKYVTFLGIVDQIKTGTVITFKIRIIATEYN